MRKSILIVILASFTFPLAAQRPASPPAQAETKIGAATITVDYSAPSRRNRVIMGGLVPWNEVWRTGANAATTLTASAPVRIGNLDVPAGKYTLYSIPGEKEWTLIVNKQTGQWGTRYDSSQDLGRVKMAVKSVDPAVETFVIGFRKGASNRHDLTLTWENVEASVPVTAR